MPNTLVNEATLVNEVTLVNEGSLKVWVGRQIALGVDGSKVTGGGTVSFFGFLPDGILGVGIQHNLGFDNVGFGDKGGYGKLGTTSQVTAFLGSTQVRENATSLPFSNPNYSLFTQSDGPSVINITSYAGGLVDETVNLLAVSGASNFEAVTQVADGSVFDKWRGPGSLQQNTEIIREASGSLTNFVAGVVAGATGAAGEVATGANLNFTLGCNPAYQLCRTAGYVSGNISYTNPGIEGFIGEQITAAITSSAIPFPAGVESTNNFLYPGVGTTSGQTITGKSVDLGEFIGNATDAIVTELTASGGNLPGRTVTAWVIGGSGATEPLIFVHNTV